MLYISSKDTDIQWFDDILACYCQGIKFCLLNSFEGMGALNKEI